MNEKFSMSEAINLIINFYTFKKGYWKDEIEQYPEVQKFVEMGCTMFDANYQDLYVTNAKGREVLHSYIEEISNQLILFMESNSLECEIEKLVDWFITTYDLKDRECGEEIASYVCDNLYHYGYKASKAVSLRKGKRYILEKL